MRPLISKNPCLSPHLRTWAQKWLERRLGFWSWLCSKFLTSEIHLTLNGWKQRQLEQKFVLTLK